MRKFIYSALIAAGLTAAGSVLAQASGLDTQPGGNAGPSFGPPVGTPEYYGNSGYVPPPTPRYYRDRDGPAYPYVVPDRRERQREREIALQRERERDFDARRDRRSDRTMGGPRDRDGDGIANRRDRFPDDPSRY